MQILCRFINNPPEKMKKNIFIFLIDFVPFCLGRATCRQHEIQNYFSNLCHELNFNFQFHPEKQFTFKYCRVVVKDVKAQFGTEIAKPQQHFCYCLSRLFYSHPRREDEKDFLYWRPLNHRVCLNFFCSSTLSIAYIRSLTLACHINNHKLVEIFFSYIKALFGAFALSLECRLWESR